MKSNTYDIVIIGGAMIGSSVAWWLTRDPTFQGRVLVVERDPSYENASTTHTNSCIRQQFGTEINIRLSQFTAQFIRDFRLHMGADAPDIPIQNFGYLYLAGSDAAATAMRTAHGLQTRLGAQTRLMPPDAIARAYPFYNLDGVVLGSHNTVDEGYFDGGTIFDHFRTGARKAGVEYRHDTVTGLSVMGGRITGVTLAQGGHVTCDQVVNAAGPRAAQIMQMAGLSLPVEPRKRFTFVFDAATALPCALPLTIDPSGVHVRSDGRYYMAGCPPPDDHAVAADDFAPDPTTWEEKVWPALAHRIPAFERLRLINEWVGHYAYNRFDQNAILGPHPDLPNLILANGFSGHGLQQSPGVGRGVAEWLVHGAWQTLDLSPLSVNRILENRPLTEPNVI